MFVKLEYFNCSGLDFKEKVTEIIKNIILFSWRKHGNARLRIIHLGVRKILVRKMFLSHVTEKRLMGGLRPMGSMRPVDSVFETTALDTEL